MEIQRLTHHHFDGIREVDAETQRQYLGTAWDEMSPSEQEHHLKANRAEIEINIATGFSLVALDESSVVGFLLAFQEPLPLRGRIYIRHVAVLPSRQGEGIGKVLYEHLINLAEAAGMAEIRTLINLDNPESIALHASSGFSFRDRKEAILEL